MSYVDSFFRAVPRVPFTLLTTAALVVGGLSGVAWAEDETVASAKFVSGTSTPRDSDNDGDLDGPDAGSASSAAQASGEPVEDLSQRTETARVFANEDGTWESEEYLAPVRMQQDGKWADVNYTLVEQPDGSWSPKASPTQVSIDGGGATEAARVTFEDGKSLALTWPDALPKPTIDGAVATYKLSAATDLVVTVTGNGVSAHIRLNEPPADADPIFTLGLVGDGVNVSKSAGGLKVQDADGELVGRASSLVAWDAEVDAAGDPSELIPLTSELTEVSEKGDVVEQELELAAPAGFLSDPTTQYPVIIDPAVMEPGRLRDTWVRSGITSNNNADPSLLVGKISGASSTNPSESLVKFYPDNISGKEVISASLRFYQYYAYSCDPRRMNLEPVTGAWNTSTVWANKPGVTNNWNTQISQQQGAAGCGDNYVTADVTSMVDAWARGSGPNEGVRLSVPGANTNQSSYGRKFCSMDPSGSHSACNSAYRVPFLSITYATPPPPPPVPVDTEPALPGMTSYGVDEYMLEDLKDIAVLEGITLDQAVALYGWQNDFASTVAQVAEAHPNEFASARLNEAGTPGGVIELTADAPSSVAAAVESATASLPADVVVEADAIYNESEQLEVVSQASDAVIAAAGTENVTAFYDDEAHVIRANVGGVSASESSLESAVQTQLDATLPPLQVPGVEITVGTSTVGSPETLRGGLQQSDPSTGSSCTIGWPVQGTFLGRLQYGIVTADHCAEDEMTRVNGINDALRVSILSLPTSKGDIAYQEKDREDVGRSFIFKSDKAPRAIKGIRKPVKGQYLCLFGRTTLGTKDGKRTCAKVEKLNTTRGKYGGMVSMSRYVSAAGDSGGPWYSGAYGVGIHSGVHARVPFGQRYSQFTPLSGTLSKLGGSNAPNGFSVRSN